MGSEGNDSIEGVAGVLVWTGGFRRMLTFYRDTLGLTPRHERATFVNFEWGDFRLSVTAHSDVHGRSRDPLRVMVNFAVDDIHAVHRRLEAAGVGFSRPPERERWGGWVATFEDPDGNTLQLLQQPP